MRKALRGNGLARNQRRRDVEAQRGDLFASVRRILRLTVPTVRCSLEATPLCSAAELVVQSTSVLRAFQDDVNKNASGLQTPPQSVTSSVVVASTSRVASLADAAAADRIDDPNEGAELSFPSSAAPGHARIDQSERTSARHYAAAVQALVYAAHACTRTVFLQHQRAIAMVLVHKAPVVHSATISSSRPSPPRSLAPLQCVLHQAAADGYLSMLLKHNVPPMSAFDLHALVRALVMRSDAEERNAQTLVAAAEMRAGDGTGVGVCPLPVGPAYPHIHASWMHSVALLSWVHDMPYEPHSRSTIQVAQRNVLDVVASVVFHLGTRQATAAVGSSPLPAKSVQHRQMLDRLLQLVERRGSDRQHNTDRLGVGDVSVGNNSSERGSGRLVAIQGKKVELVDAPSYSAAVDDGDGAKRNNNTSASASVSTHLASECLIEGQWERVLAAFSRLVAVSWPSQNVSQRDGDCADSHSSASASLQSLPPMCSWPFYRAYLHHARHPHDARHRQELESTIAATKRRVKAIGTMPEASPTFVGGVESSAQLLPRAAEVAAAVDTTVRKFLVDHVVPDYAPRPLVCFEGHGRRMLAYMLRSRLWEFLPFACTAAASSDHPETLSALREHLLLPLYRQHLSLASGDSTMNRGDGMPSLAWTHTYQSLGDLLVHHATTLLTLTISSLSLHRHTLLTTYRPWWLPDVADVPLLCAGAAAAALHPDCSICLLGPEAPRGDGDTPWWCLRHGHSSAVRRVANHMDNYWLSCWIECLCTMGPVGRVHRLMGALSQHHRVPFVVGPECAVAIATSITLRALRMQSSSNSDVGAQQPPSVGDDQVRIRRAIQASLPRLIAFVVPEDKTPAHYFKWLQSNDFYHRLTTSPLPDGSDNGGAAAAEPAGTDAAATPCSVASQAWSSPLGLLGGRCYRLATHMPSIATKQQQQQHHRVCMEVWGLDVGAIVAAALLQGAAPAGLRAAGGLATGVEEGTVQTMLAFQRSAAGRAVDLLALYKPPGLATTLHSGTPSVASFLASNLGGKYPWVRADDDHNASTALLASGGSSTGDGDAGSVLAQEGLINRIDRATSGIVLAARSEACLFEQRRANLAERLTPKVYYAIVVHVPPTDRAIASPHLWTPGGSGAFFLPPKGVIGGEVFAEGSFYSHRISHQYSKRPAGNAASSADAPQTGQRSFLGVDQREASTEYAVVEHFPSRGIYLVRAVLRSGRRHQIRQHFASIHHPLLGDVQYHPRAANPWIQRTALHAAEVAVFRGAPTANSGDGDGDEGSVLERLLTDQRRVVVSCDLPADMRRALQTLRRIEAGASGSPVPWQQSQAAHQ